MWMIAQAKYILKLKILILQQKILKQVLKLEQHAKNLFLIF